MERALRAAGGEVERLALKGHDHNAAGHAAGEAEGPWLPRAVNWMSRHLHSFA
jgi:dipeptidyl aminopeptidase/acylaminoacyl peptidase